MRRFRWLFVAVAVALLVPITVLVHRAVRSVTLERQLHHQAVAERVFDEVEREIGTVLVGQRGQRKLGVREVHALLAAELRAATGTVRDADAHPRLRRILHGSHDAAVVEHHAVPDAHAVEDFG